MDNETVGITPQEWKELYALNEITRGRDLENADVREILADTVFGVKIKSIAGIGYRGETFAIYGVPGTGERLIVIRNKDGKLEVLR